MSVACTQCCTSLVCRAKCVIDAVFLHACSPMVNRLSIPPSHVIRCLSTVLHWLHYTTMYIVYCTLYIVHVHYREVILCNFWVNVGGLMLALFLPSRCGDNCQWRTVYIYRIYMLIGSSWGTKAGVCLSVYCGHGHWAIINLSNQTTWTLLLGVKMTISLHIGCQNYHQITY